MIRSPKKWTSKRQRFYADSETQHGCRVAKKMDEVLLEIRSLDCKSSTPASARPTFMNSFQRRVNGHDHGRAISSKTSTSFRKEWMHSSFFAWGSKTTTTSFREEWMHSSFFGGSKTTTTSFREEWMHSSFLALFGDPDCSSWMHSSFLGGSKTTTTSFREEWMHSSFLAWGSKTTMTSFREEWMHSSFLATAERSVR